MKHYKALLDTLKQSGNFRTTVAAPAPCGCVDFSTNDYMGLAESLATEGYMPPQGAWTSSASRLLASDRTAYQRLENRLAQLYDRPVLLFNSGWHANTGLVSAFCRGARTLIVADRLVHASIIDGIRLSGAPFERFRHNDIAHLTRLLDSKAGEYERVILIVESVYSMDGDRADIDALVRLRDRFDNLLLYVDEAHAFGVEGPRGLGLCRASAAYSGVDVVVGTFGKAAASVGAFAAMSDTLRDVAVNCARSFIFSTALPPVMCEHTLRMVERLLDMDDRREHLQRLGRLFRPESPQHIIPVIVGDSRWVCYLSEKLSSEYGFKVLPIRTPTVPPGTERLRISLSAARTVEQVEELNHAINRLITRS